MTAIPLPLHREPRWPALLPLVLVLAAVIAAGLAWMLVAQLQDAADLADLVRDRCAVGAIVDPAVCAGADGVLDEARIGSRPWP